MNYFYWENTKNALLCNQTDWVDSWTKLVHFLQISQIGSSVPQSFKVMTFFKFSPVFWDNGYVLSYEGHQNFRSDYMVHGQKRLESTGLHSTVYTVCFGLRQRKTKVKCRAT